MLGQFGEAKGELGEPETSEGATAGKELEDGQVIIPVLLAHPRWGRDTQIQGSDMVECGASGDEAGALSESVGGVYCDVTTEATQGGECEPASGKGAGTERLPVCPKHLDDDVEDLLGKVAGLVGERAVPR